jgi:hypothetical protein
VHFLAGNPGESQQVGSQYQVQYPCHLCKTTKNSDATCRKHDLGIMCLHLV